MDSFSEQKLLVANRGEIAVRILRTANELGIKTVAVYSPSDALSPHVLLADEAFSFPLPASQPEGNCYLSISSIIDIATTHGVTLLHPGYGFLSENAEFAAAVSKAGITWLGPKPEVIYLMGLKHEARATARAANILVVPGSQGLVTEENASKVAEEIGFPLMLKATAGGGGLGMVVCSNATELKEKLPQTIERAKALFHNEDVFLERYISRARHIEVQVFGNGLGDVVHMGERECSVQRRNQKIIEETPSPFFHSRPAVREAMCAAAVRLCRSIKYSSAGTVEFIVDDDTGNFYFLEMNTRIQVEHPITEAVHPGLDLVKLMIQQGLAERSGNGGLAATGSEMDQSTYLLKINPLHAIEVRIYAEDPSASFRPCPGILQHVKFDCKDQQPVRVDGWIATGTTITSFFDPLLCKLIVTSNNRLESLTKLVDVLREIEVQGPPNNIEYLAAIIQDKAFQAGSAHTRFLETFKFTPRAFSILSGGLEATVQDFPGRTTGIGLPRSGPMDSVAFRAANILCGNPPTTEGLEIIAIPGLDFVAKFHISAVVAITGKDVDVLVDREQTPMWATVVVPHGATLSIQAKNELRPGLRVYLAFRGGFPAIPRYLGSKSTSMGLGGYQGRSLLPGDQITLSESAQVEPEVSVPSALRPQYTTQWQIYVLSGPHDDEEFVTPQGVESFYNTDWRVSPSSNRLGIRLESANKIVWARKNGGEGGSHPSNILDNGYAPGSININGDTPVILTNEGPDMGGYVCLCTVATGDMWKLGQLSPGSTVRFVRTSWEQARAVEIETNNWLQNLRSPSLTPYNPKPLSNGLADPKLHKSPKANRPTVVFRQAGDSAILVEFGSMTLNFTVRAWIHAFETAVRKLAGTNVIKAFCPCIRSTMCLYYPSAISQAAILKLLIQAEESLPDSVDDMVFNARKITFPIVLDDSWNRQAVERYMKSIRNKAVYLPSNVEYLARNNGLRDRGEALQRLIASDWLVFGVGFYLACPFLVPIDPRCRLVGQKMNPSRTYTPQGAIGIAGVVAAIYPIESPGGYQLFGRTLPAWQTWGKGKDFDESRPWLLDPFDQVHFEQVDEEEYLHLENLFKAGQYEFKVELTTFSMPEYLRFVDSIAAEVSEFRAKQAEAVVQEETREEQLLKEWESEKVTQPADNHAGEYAAGQTTVPSPLFASVWKIQCQTGDLIETGDEILVILEAMKTEIPVKAGVANKGKKVKGPNKAIKEGAMVSPGDALIILE